LENVFVGRQPIFDAEMNLFAYELLFRSGENVGHAGVVDGDMATTQVMLNAFMDIGMDHLVGSQFAFINLTRRFLVGEHPLPFTPDRVVLEVLEDVEPDAEVVAAVRRLAERGFTIALDDFIYREEMRPLIELADIIKIDLMALEAGALPEQVRCIRADNPRVHLLAEKVETHDEFSECRALGFDYFQGYFLSRPNVVKGERLAGNRLAILNLMAELQDPEADMARLEQLISRDVALAYRLLRYINSAAFGLNQKVESVLKAVNLLGIRAVKNWVSLMLLANIDDKPRELMVNALVRAKMCELLAAARKRPGREQYFTAGLFSMLDALMDRPLPELIDALPLSDGIKVGVLDREGPVGDTLQQVIDYEAGAFDALADADLPPEAFTESYVAAVAWARESSSALDER